MKNKNLVRRMVKECDTTEQQFFWGHGCTCAQNSSQHSLAFSLFKTKDEKIASRKREAAIEIKLSWRGKNSNEGPIQTVIT